jgi:hypothetical protein
MGDLDTRTHTFFCGDLADVKMHLSMTDIEIPW